MLEGGHVPARKVGGVWLSTRGELHAFLLGTAQSPTRAPKGASGNAVQTSLAE
jgi:hypothetical protein